MISGTGADEGPPTSADVPDRSPEPPERRWSRSTTIDAVVVLLLGAAAFLARRGTLPEDGLWFDDAWVAAGALEGTWSNLMVVGSGQPGFTAALMGWADVAGGGPTGLARPALIAGTLGPPSLYLALRRIGYARSICVLLGAAFVVADFHILYSGRVKGYTLDPLVVLAITMALPRAVRATWRWPGAVAWAVAAVALGSISGFSLVATVAAAAVAVLHPRSDRLVRVAAVAAQGIAQLGLLVWARRSSDLEKLESDAAIDLDGYIDLGGSPVRAVADVVEHLARVARVYPGGSGWPLAPLALAAVAGLVAAAVVRRSTSESIRARLLLVITAIGVAGASLELFPFGTTTNIANPFSSGARLTLWLLPVMAVGLGAFLHRLRHLVHRWPAVTRGFDALAVGVALVVLVAGQGPSPTYPFPGSASAADFIAEERRPGDAVLVGNVGIYAFAIEAGIPFTLHSKPDRVVGFTPRFGGEPIFTIGEFGDHPVTPAAVRPLIAGADRVFVFVAIQGIGVGPPFFDPVLRSVGLRPASSHDFDQAQVVVYRR